MNKRNAQQTVRRIRVMLKQLDTIQDAVLFDSNFALWSVATAARWAVSALEDVIQEVVNSQ